MGHRDRVCDQTFLFIQWTVLNSFYVFKERGEGSCVVDYFEDILFADDILVVAEFIALLMSVSAKKEYHNREKHGAFQKAVANVY